MPNGAYQAGIARSTNAPRRTTRRQRPSKTSTRPLWKSVAYSRSPAIASPRNTAALAASSTATSATSDQLWGTAGDQPRIVPSSEA